MVNSQYGVENIIRIGSAGSYTDKAKLFDVVLATGAYSESNYAVTQSGDTDDIQRPSCELNNALRASAAAQNIPLIEGKIAFFGAVMRGRHKRTLLFRLL